MRVAVVGAGAIGGTLAALLAARGGHEVALVGREPATAATRRVEVHGVAGAHRVEVATRPRAPDLVVLATKTHDLDGAAKDAGAWAGEATVVTIQNGLAAEAIAGQRLGPERVVGCVTDVIAELDDPALPRVRVAHLGALVLGQPGQAAGTRVRDVAGAFAAAGLPARTTDNLAGARWLKLLVNLNNALPAATGRPVQDLYDQPGMPALAARMLREGLAVARAEGVRLEALPSAGPLLVRAAAALPPGLAGPLLRRRVRKVGKRGPITGSTLQSLRRGRRTEIDFLNGEVVARGRTRSIGTPVNRVLVEAVHAIEGGAPFLAPEELLARAGAPRAQVDAPIGI